jgi:glycosyltransferase involved in cell wall biosynthesis
VADPNPRELARAFDRLYEDRDRAERMGSAQASRAGALHISWDHVVSRLLA